MDINSLSRIDRAVADNIKDIQRSFGSQAGIVQDFIVFISRRLKTDLFGYTRFTLHEFCQQTGRRRQELAIIHPDFISGKRLPPLMEGYAFSTVIDYALYSMMERNIIFSSKYEVKGKDTTIQMQSFPILKDLKLNFNRKDKDQKIYEIRLSDELLQGFLSRYYTLNTESYRLVGKGRGGDSRKKLLLYLSKLSHVLISTGQTETILPLDRLCQFADITDTKPSHKKQNLLRMLNHLQVVGKFPFHFTFVSGKQYDVRLIFTSAISKQAIRAEHNFYLRLMNGLHSIFQCTQANHRIIDKDPFQVWLSRSDLDTEAKAQVLSQTYYLSLHITITHTDCITLIRNGNFLRPFSDVR